MPTAIASKSWTVAAGFTSKYGRVTLRDIDVRLAPA